MDIPWDLVYTNPCFVARHAMYCEILFQKLIIDLIAHKLYLFCVIKFGESTSIILHVIKNRRNAKPYFFE